MLQIITGKFYESDDRYHNQGKAVLYSNVEYYDPIVLQHIYIEPAGSDGEVYTYVVSYDNQLEKSTSTGGMLIRIGDPEIVQQVKLILSFSFNAVFDEEKAVITRLCRKKGSQYHNLSVPSAFFNSSMLEYRFLTQDEVQHTIGFFDAILALKRDDYLAVISCLSAYTAALKLLDEDVSLAYSMLVFSLESLSQNTDQYTPIWEDYGEEKRNQLDRVFKSLPEETSQKIKEILIKDEHLKLSKRFVEFVKNHLNIDFWIKGSETVSTPIQYYDIEQALKNAYTARSQYAHMLQPVAKQLQLPDYSKSSDYFLFQNSIHFTVSGLFRVVRNVINNFVFEREKVEKESIDWRHQLPGIINVEFVPQYWIRGVGQSPVRQFSGLLSLLVNSSQTTLPDMRDTLQSLQSRFSQLSPENKHYAFALILLYNTTICQEARSNNYTEFIERNKSMLTSCHLANVVLTTVPVNYDYTFNYDVREVEKCINSYNKNKHKKNRIRLPREIETIIYLRLAESSLKNGDVVSFQRHMDEAIYNSCGSKDLQEKMMQSQKSQVAYDSHDFIKETFKILF